MRKETDVAEQSDLFQEEFKEETDNNARSELVVVLIKPLSSQSIFDWRDLWAYRELLYFLIWRDIKVRYKQTAIGVAWAILQPITTTLIFSILFGRAIHSQYEKTPYTLFVFVGFALWAFVSNGVSFASNSLIGNSNLVTKIYFPRLIMPLAAVVANLLDLFLSFVLLGGLMLYYGVFPTWKMLLLLLSLVHAVILTFGIGTILAALNVRFRDIKFIVPFGLQLWLFISPIFYSIEILPEEARWVWKLNPLAGVLNSFRAELFGSDFDIFAIITSIVTSLLILLISLFVFQKMEDSFADLI